MHENNTQKNRVVLWQLLLDSTLECRQYISSNMLFSQDYLAVVVALVYSDRCTEEEWL
jgi:hypothetical protein